MEDFIFKLIGFVITAAIIYFIGAFIAWDVNPLNWWLFTSSGGRLIAIIIFLFLIYANFIKE